MHKLSMKKWVSFLLPVLSVLIFVFTSIYAPFYTVDARLTDSLYTQLNGVSRNIKMITVDEETLAQYGNFTNWSKEKCADLINLLYEDAKTAPAVVGVDFLFIGESDPVTDTALTTACQKAGNVVFGSNLVYRGATKQAADGSLYYDSWNVDMVELPFEALRNVSDYGFANAHIASDGCVRYTKLTENYNSTPVKSFAYTIYETYMQHKGLDITLPACDNRGMFTFFYSGENG